MICTRKAVYRLYQNRAQNAALLDMLGAHQRLYNSALEQRITAWRLGERSLTLGDQSRDLTELRSVDDEYRALNAQSSQVTLKRLDLAYSAFFRRLKTKPNEKAGFPRFKSFHRFSGWGYKTHGDGFRLQNATTALRDSAFLMASRPYRGGKHYSVVRGPRSPRSNKYPGRNRIATELTCLLCVKSHPYTVRREDFNGPIRSEWSRYHLMRARIVEHLDAVH